MNREIFPRIFASVLSVALLSTGVAYAQNPPENPPENPAPATTANSAQPAATPAITLQPYWEPMAGFDIDSHSTGYLWAGPQYQHPLRENLWLTGRVAANYLFYEYADSGGRTKVTGPGFNAQVGLKVGGRNWVKLGAGPGFRHRNARFVGDNGFESASDGEWRTGLNLSLDAYVHPTSRTNVMGQVQYGTEDSFTWGRLVGKRQLSNFSYSAPIALFVGAEGVGMRNPDFRSLQGGALFEFLHVKSSVSIGLRAGYKRQMDPFGPDKTGPYFGIGYYQRLK